MCHLLLAKIYKNSSLCCAAVMMSNFKKYNSRNYEWLKKQYNTYQKSDECKNRKRLTREKNGTDKLKNDHIEKIKLSHKNRDRNTYPGGNKGTSWLNNGVISRPAHLTEIDDLIKNGWVLGRFMTDVMKEKFKEVGKKVGKSTKGICLTEEHRKKIGISNIGKTFSPETKRKQSESAKNRPGISEETRMKLKNRPRRKHTEETKRKIAETKRNNKIRKELENEQSGSEILGFI